MSRLAGWGGTVPAASVPVTVTVCRPRADTILPAQAAWRRAPCFLSLASMRALPAFLNAVGAAPGGDGPSGTASCPGRGPRMVSRAGWIWVHGPRIRPSVWLTCLAGSRSKPVSMLSAAASSSEVLMALRVWGMVRAAPAITAASFASVLALPGVRSAMRRTGQPGRAAHGGAHVPGHRHGQGPDGGGLVHHHQKVTVGGRLLVQGAQTRLVAWQGLVEDLLAALGQGRGPVVSLADVDADEDLDVLDIHLSGACSMVCVSPDGGTGAD